jgi:hypothetical protein
MGITVAPLTGAVMGSVDRHRAGVASGVNNAVARAASLLAVAGLAVVLRGRFDHVLDLRLRDLPLAPADAARVAAERSKLAAAELTGFDPTTFGGVRAAFDDAYVAGFRAVTLTCALLSAVAAMVGLVSAPPSRSRPSGASRAEGPAAARRQPASR